LGCGLEKRYINLVYQPIVEADGSVSGIFAEGHDVTHQKRAETALRQLNEILEQQVKERTYERDLVWRIGPAGAEVRIRSGAGDRYRTSRPIGVRAGTTCDEDTAGDRRRICNRR